MELSRINKAIDDLRMAENSGKAPFLKQLRAEVCQEHCVLRDKCIEAYEAHIEALSLIEDAGRRGKDEAARRLDQAEGRLKEALVQIKACTSLQAELSR